MPTIIFEKDLPELFLALHHSKLFKDGKSISDAILKYTPTYIKEQFHAQKVLPSFDLQVFFEKHFELSSPKESYFTSDTSLSISEHIHNLWPVLTRQPHLEDTIYSTLIQLPHPYIVPGGRFNEIYYWDSYFTMLGLQASGRVDLIQNMVDNFSHLIDTYGFIPNGNRSYYLGRSQPPFFALMVSLLAEEKGKDILVKYLPALEKEYQYWMNGREEDGEATKRVVKIDDVVLNRYFDNILKPRTEMYSDDIELIEKESADGQKMITHIRAACESGWDFSSRWCADPLILETIHTTDIIPIDLNCLLFYLQKTMRKGRVLRGDKLMGINSLIPAGFDRKKAINELLWNEKTKFYHDYDFVEKEHKKVYSLAGYYPLFFEIATPEQAAHCADKVETMFLKAGGLISTTLHTGQQWDAPNGWAPLQWIVIQGLRNYGFNDLANTIKKRWCDLNIKVYKDTGKLMEKYNVEDIHLESGGGEYPVQDGFGWTNGVLLKLLSE